MVVHAALDYAKKGYAVIPTHSIIGDYCTCGKRIDSGDCSAGKHPASPHGYQDATTDIDIITRWWADMPCSNVAIPTHGKKHFVLECDPKHGGDVTIARLVEEHGELPVTPTVKSGGDGRHWYFAYPEGVAIKSRSDVAKGVDVRGDNGYVVAPPSRHKSGNRYEWIHDLDTPLAQAPGWVLDLVCDPKTRTTTTSTSSSSPTQGAFVFAHDPDFATHPGAFEGARNDTLMRLLGTHFARHDTIEDIYDLAYAWADRCDPPVKYKDIDRRIQAIANKREAEGEDMETDDEDETLTSFLPDSGKKVEPDSSPESEGASFLPSLLPDPENAPDSNPGSKTLPLLPTLLADPLTINVPVPVLLNETRYTDNDTGTSTVLRIRNTGTGTDYVIRNTDTEPDTNRITYTYYVNGDGNDAETVGEPESRNSDDRDTDTRTDVGGGGALPPGDEASPPDSGSERRKEGSKPPEPAIVPSFPTLAPEAYHGIVGAIVRAIEPETEADPAGVLVSLVTHIGNAVGLAPHFVVGTTCHRANLFACLVGDTTAGKGIAESVVEYLMRKAVPDSKDDLGHGLSSGEGLIDRVRDEDPLDADGEDAFTFVVPTEKRLLAIETEFFRVVTAMRREGNTLSAILRSAWDGDILETITRTRPGEKKGARPAKPMRATSAHVSVIGHITPVELTSAMGKNGGIDLANGFANRFLWAFVTRSKSLPEGGDASVLDAFVEPLARAIATARMIGGVRRDEDAKALWASIYEKLTAPKPGAFGLVVGRGRAHVVRLALLYAILDGEDTIRVPHLKAALALWDYCEASASRIFGGVNAGAQHGQPEPVSIRILDAIVKTPGITRTDLLRDFREINADTMTVLLSTFETQGLAHKRMKETAGRWAEAWYPGTRDDSPPDHEDNKTPSSQGAFTFGFDEEPEGGKEGNKGACEAPFAEPAEDTSFLPVADDAGVAEAEQGDEIPPPSITEPDDVPLDPAYLASFLSELDAITNTYKKG